MVKVKRGNGKGSPRFALYVIFSTLLFIYLYIFMYIIYAF